MAKHNELGEWGENEAREFLITKGYTVHCQNERSGRKEVDIIAFKDDTVRFVEVKTRSTAVYQDPVDAVDSRKMRRMTRFADSYISGNQIRHTPHFDIIAITGTPETGVVNLEWLPDAFLPVAGR